MDGISTSLACVGSSLPLLLWESFSSASLSSWSHPSPACPTAPAPGMPTCAQVPPKAGKEASFSFLGS